MWFNNESLFIWMVIAHVAFLIVPGMMALTYEWFQSHPASGSGHRHLSDVIPIGRNSNRPAKAA